MSDSVPQGDTHLDIIEVLTDAGGPRAAWAIIDICVDEDRPLPHWVLNYLAGVAREMPKVHRRDLLSLWRAAGLYDERKGSYDPDRDPDFIYARIAQMEAEGEVRNVAEGARLYGKRYGLANDPESIRKQYYKGLKDAGSAPDGTEPEAQACIMTRTGRRRAQPR